MVTPDEKDEKESNNERSNRSQEARRRLFGAKKSKRHDDSDDDNEEEEEPCCVSETTTKLQTSFATLDHQNTSLPTNTTQTIRHRHRRRLANLFRNAPSVVHVYSIWLGTVATAMERRLSLDSAVSNNGTSVGCSLSSIIGFIVRHDLLSIHRGFCAISQPLKRGYTDTLEPLGSTLPWRNVEKSRLCRNKHLALCHLPSRLKIRFRVLQ